MAVAEQGDLAEARRQGCDDDTGNGEPAHRAQGYQKESRSWKYNTRSHPHAGKNVIKACLSRGLQL